ncbi:MAG TPA: hypothetical protein VMF30_20020 [Pirellulales bacterium]|nr:hypothetical protein [Pirellulales bacterium]
MKYVACCAWAVVFAVAAVANAADLKSGPQPGDKLEAFDVTKLAGAGNDNVPIDQKLCYRCLYGDRPVVMVFTQQLDKELADLITALDKEVGENGDKKLASFVNLMGPRPDILKQAANAIVNQLNVKNIPVVMPEDPMRGPEAYKLNPKAAVTVLIYRDSTVKANYALAPGKLDKQVIDKIVSDTKKMLN